MRIVNKPWGEEHWIELNDRYCYKRIVINKGYRTSFQYHEKKLETNLLVYGSLRLTLENDNGVVEERDLVVGDSFTVSPMKKHRMEALTNMEMLEVSTPEVDDVVRIEDDTNRPDGRIDGEHSV